MKRFKLSPEEKEIEESFARGEFHSVKNFEHVKKRLQKAARETLKIIRKKNATSILHRYAMGNL